MAMMNILLPVDGSESALHAVRHAIALVRGGLRARFTLANVQAPNTLYEMVVAHDPEVLERIAREAAEHLLQPAQALLEADGVSHEVRIAVGDAAHELLDMVETDGCDAIILGAGGTTARTVILGSVSHWLVDHAPVPVTVVRAAEDRRDEASSMETDDTASEERDDASGDGVGRVSGGE
jgi:nucleotide-binding universal stress UspA family protein